MTRIAASSIGDAPPLDRAYPVTPRGVRRLASEPFVHFTLLGALLFAGHRHMSRAPEAPMIEVSAAKQREIVKLFEQRQHRPPNDAERQQALQRYVEDEVLFREGLRLSLVNNDPMIRAQIVARVRGMLQAEVDGEAPSDADLERYFAVHRADYAVPETVTYREYFFRSGPEATEESRRLLRTLQRGEETQAGPGLPLAADHSRISQDELVTLYGEETAHALWTLPADTWRELRSRHGVHLVRVAEHTPAAAPSFEAVRAGVSTDYRKERTALAFQGELDRLRSEWRVHVEGQP